MVSGTISRPLELSIKELEDASVKHFFSQNQAATVTPAEQDESKTAGVKRVKLNTETKEHKEPPRLMQQRLQFQSAVPLEKGSSADPTDVKTEDAQTGLVGFEALLKDSLHHYVEMFSQCITRSGCLESNNKEHITRVNWLYSNEPVTGTETALLKDSHRSVQWIFGTRKHQPDLIKLKETLRTRQLKQFPVKSSG